MPKSAAYAIMNQRLNLDIAILDISSLHLHEQIIPELLGNLVHCSRMIEGRRYEEELYVFEE